MKQKPFIKLSKDLMFQIFFKQSKRCLLSLLNAFIPMPKGKTITDAQILDPANLPSSPKGKLSIMDIKVKLNDGELINIELQTFNQTRFKSRTLFYWAKLYSGQLAEKDSYLKLKKTISLIFADFLLLNRGSKLLIRGQKASLEGEGPRKGQRQGQGIGQGIRQGIGQGIGQGIRQGIRQGIKQGQAEEGDFFNSFSIRSDKAPHPIFVEDLQMLTVELGRFLKKDLNLLVDPKDLWCYFIKESHNLSLDDLKHLSSKGEDMKIAAEHLIKLSQDESLRALEEAQQKAEWKEIGIFEHGKTKGREEGMEKGIEKGIVRGREEGMEKGREEGMEKGREEGMEKGTERLVLNMLRKNMDLCLISELSGWSEEKILKLKNKA